MGFFNLEFATENVEDGAVVNFEDPAFVSHTTDASRSEERP